MALRSSKLTSALSVALCCCCMSNVDAYFSVHENSTVPVPTSEQVSPDQLFAKELQITTWEAYPLDTLDITLPGRVFVTYAENTSTDAGDSITLANIKISGSSKDGLESVVVAQSFGDEQSLSLYMRYPVMSSGALLVEIQLLTKNALKEIRKTGECDVVVLENVLYSSDKDPFLGDENYRSRRRITLNNNGVNGSIFVADKTGSVAVEEFEISAFAASNVQVELAAINASDGMSTTPRGSGNITLFVDDLEATVDASLSTFSLDDYAEGKVCISAKNSVNVTVDNGTSDAHISYPGKQAGAFPCVKLDLPARVPGRIGGGEDVAAESGTAAPRKSTSAAVSVRGLSPVFVAVSGLVTSLLIAIV